MGVIRAKPIYSSQNKNIYKYHKLKFGRVALTNCFSRLLPPPKKKQNQKNNKTKKKKPTDNSGQGTNFKSDLTLD